MDDHPGFSSGGKKSHEDRAASVPNGLNGTYMWVTSFILHNWDNPPSRPVYEKKC